MKKKLLRIIALAAVVCSSGFAEDVFPVFGNGYLTSDRSSVYIVNPENTYLGSSDEDGTFIALGRRPATSAFGRINEDGTVLIIYCQPDEEGK